MADMTIPEYDAAGGIDAANDLFLIWQNSTNTYRNITRNVILGSTGTPVTTTASQALQNKTLDNTNTVTIKDTLFTLQDNSDTSKQAQFQLSGITTATTRTYTLPDASSTLVDISTTQTLTNKTLTSPVITGGTIDNSTITVDSITGHTTANSGTIYGVTVSSAQISGAAIANTTIPYTALTTDSSWSYSTFTPSPTGFSGSVTVTIARYKQIGKTVSMDINFSGTSNATTCTFTLPVAAKSNVSYGGIVTDNGSLQTTLGLLTLTGSGSSTVTCFKTLTGSAFTSSGTKGVQVSGLTYEAN